MQPWQRYTLETKIIGYDAKAVYVEQRFVVGRELYAVGFVRGRFLSRRGGTVSVAELARAIGVDVTDTRAARMGAALGCGCRTAAEPRGRDERLVLSRGSATPVG